MQPLPHESAIEVPPYNLYAPSFHVLNIFTPGAINSNCSPLLDKSSVYPLNLKRQLQSQNRI